MHFFSFHAPTQRHIFKSVRGFVRGLSWFLLLLYITFDLEYLFTLRIGFDKNCFTERSLYGCVVTYVHISLFAWKDRGLCPFCNRASTGCDNICHQEGDIASVPEYKSAIRIVSHSNGVKIEQIVLKLDTGLRKTG